MALSGSFTTNAYAEGRYYTLSWTASQNIANNTSTINWTLSCAGGVSWYAERTLKLVIDGQTVYSKTARVERYAGTIATGSLTAGHNSEGKKSFSASLQVAVYDSYVNVTGSGNFTLNDIPRKSELTISNGTLGTAQTIGVTRKSTAFTHTITYYSGSYSGTLCTKSSATSFSFAPPLEWANNGANATSVVACFTIQTYSGSTLIGSNSYYISYTIPASIKPTVSFTIADAEGYLSSYGKYIQAKSKLKIAITAAGAYGSTIKSYNTTADGKTYTEANITTDVIVGSGTLTISVAITDSRGRMATASKTVDVFEYTPPQISSFEVYRCSSNGTANSSGAYMAVKFSAAVTSLGSKNTAAYKVSRKKTSQTSYTTETLSTLSGVYTVTNNTYIFAAETASSYDVILDVTDAFSTTQKQGVGPSTAHQMSFHYSGKGVAFGKTAEKEGVLESDYPAYFNKDANFDGNANFKKASSFDDDVILNKSAYLKNGAFIYAKDESNVDVNVLQDYIVAQGTSGKWAYRKWNSGIAECWLVNAYYPDHNATFTQASWANGFSPAEGYSSLPQYPFNFINIPNCSIRYVLADNNYGDVMIIEAGGNPSLTVAPPVFRMWRGTQATIGHPRFVCYTIGYWK